MNTARSEIELLLTELEDRCEQEAREIASGYRFWRPYRRRLDRSADHLISRLRSHSADFYARRAEREKASESTSEGSAGCAYEPSLTITAAQTSAANVASNALADEKLRTSYTVVAENPALDSNVAKRKPVCSERRTLDVNWNSKNVA
jgi:hypothetical protein